MLNARAAVRQTGRVGLITAALSLALAVPANAQATLTGGLVEPQPGVGNVTGSTVTPVGASPARTQQVKDKVAATLAWDAATKAGDTAGASAARNGYAAKWDTANQTAATSVSPSAVLRPSAVVTPSAVSRGRVLNVIQVGQHTKDYCGPASGYMVIRALHGAGFSSRYDGSAPGQARLANANHMNTNATHNTDWSSGRWVTGVNRWRGGRYYVQLHAPSASYLHRVFAYSMGGGMPFAGNTVEFKGGAHYNKHPDRTIGHWIVGYGYASSSGVGYWADSATTVFPNAARTFSYGISSFSIFLKTNGIAY